MLCPASGATVTEAELLSHGVDPNCPFGRRVPSYPLDVRCGDDRYMRSASGGVTVFFGYYDPARERMRVMWAQEVAAELRATLPHLVV